MINNLSNLIVELNSKRPLSVIRLGNVEAHQMLMKDNSVYRQMPTNAGFFGGTKEVCEWKSMVLQAMLNADLNFRVISCNSFWICDDVLTQLKLFVPTLPYIEDVAFWVSLINAIQTNKLGFVTFFKKDCEQQLPKMNFIHKKRPIESRFKSWKIIKSENTIAGNEPDDKTWKEVYDDLLKRSLEADCDIYFLSCGCYGIPLCNDLKKAGKKAIYVGGFLQLLFGLKGKRWDDRKMVNQYFNSHWRYPTEKPENASLVEGGCYWGEEKVVSA